MAQEREYGAAQPIVDFLRKGVNTVKSVMDSIPPQPRKQDNTWLDKKVAEANETYRKSAEKEAAKKKVVKKPLQSAGMTKKPTTSKSTPKKMVAGKR